MCSFRPMPTKATKGWKVLKVLEHKGKGLLTVYQNTPVKPNSRMTAKRPFITDEVLHRVDYGLSAFARKQDALAFIELRYHLGSPHTYYIAPVTIPANEPKVKGGYFIFARGHKAVQTIVSNVQDIGTPVAITNNIRKKV